MKAVFKQYSYQLSTLISIITLLLWYWLIRYVCFEMHHMKEWPFVLLVMCMIGMVLSFLCKKKIVPVAISLSYVIGFFLGTVFETIGQDPGGGRTSNRWLIWTATILIVVIVTPFLETTLKNRKIVHQ